jgi:hypothetical protein
MVKLKIRRGDKVVVLAGRDKGKHGEVMKAFPAENKVVTEPDRFQDFGRWTQGSLRQAFGRSDR